MSETGDKSKSDSGFIKETRPQDLSSTPSGGIESPALPTRPAPPFRGGSEPQPVTSVSGNSIDEPVQSSIPSQLASPEASSGWQPDTGYVPSPPERGFTAESGTGLMIEGLDLVAPEANKVFQAWREQRRADVAILLGSQGSGTLRIEDVHYLQNPKTTGEFTNVATEIMAVRFQTNALRKEQGLHDLRTVGIVTALKGSEIRDFLREYKLVGVIADDSEDIVYFISQEGKPVLVAIQQPPIPVPEPGRRDASPPSSDSIDFVSAAAQALSRLLGNRGKRHVSAPNTDSKNLVELFPPASPPTSLDPLDALSEAAAFRSKEIESMRKLAEVRSRVGLSAGIDKINAVLRQVEEFSSGEPREELNRAILEKVRSSIQEQGSSSGATVVYVNDSNVSLITGVYTLMPIVELPNLPGDPRNAGLPHINTVVDFEGVTIPFAIHRKGDRGTADTLTHISDPYAGERIVAFKSDPENQYEGMLLAEFAAYIASNMTSNGNFPVMTFEAGQIGGILDSLDIIINHSSLRIGLVKREEIARRFNELRAEEPNGIILARAMLMARDFAELDRILKEFNN